MKKLRRVLIGLGVILAVGYFAIIIAIIILLHPKLATFLPLPSPNGYDDFTNASALFTPDVGTTFFEKTYPMRALPQINVVYGMRDLQALQSFIRSNAAALELVRKGLSRECSVPTEAMFLNFTNMMNDLAGQKRLAQLLNGEGRLAELEGRTNDAARSYLDCIRFGNEVSRGGVIINRMVGMACEAIGCSALARIAPTISSNTSMVVIAELMAMDTNAVTWDEVMTNEKAFVRHERRGSFNPIRLAADWWQSRAILKGPKVRHHLSAVKRRLIAAELALRVYQSEHGQPPAQLSDLVPRYLLRIPTDPFTEKELISRPQGTNWLLYSVGEDGKDDGGIPATGRNLGVKGDVLFNAP